MTAQPTTITEGPAALEAVLLEYLRAVEAGQAPDRQALLARHPHLAAELAALLDDEASLAPLMGKLRAAPESAAPPLASFGDFEILEELGQGGMGVVYKARQVSLDRLVALKVVRAAAGASEQELARFRIEATSAARLDHPNIVPVYQVGEHAGVPFLVMKLVEGTSLAADLPHFRRQPRAAAHLLARIARAIQHAHERGVLHRDLKPGNVLLDRRKQPHVADFGLARPLEGAEDGPTRPGAVLGTPSYMAPEQAAGRSDLGVGVDVYGLGAILYEMLTGVPPFRGKTARETVRMVLDREPVPPRRLNPDAPRDLETICLKCLEKDPERRYATAERLAEDLEAFVEGRPIRARPAGRVERLVKAIRRRPALAALTAALFLTALVGVGVFWWKSTDAAKAQAAANEMAAREQQEPFESAEKTLARAEAALVANPFLVERLLNDPEAIRPDLRGPAWASLLACSRLNPHSLASASGNVRDLLYSPDGRFLAVRGFGSDTDQGHFIKILDAADGTILLTVRPENVGPLDVEKCATAFTPDGKRFVCQPGQTVGTLGEDGDLGVETEYSQLLFWDLPRGRTTQERLPAAGNARVRSPFSRAELVEYLHTRKVHRRLDVADDLPEIAASAVVPVRSPDGKALAWRRPARQEGDDSKEAEAYLTNPAGGERRELAAGETVECLVFSPDGKRVAGLVRRYHSPDLLDRFLPRTPERAMVVWDAATGGRVASWPEPAELEQLHYPLDPANLPLAFGPDGRTLAWAFRPSEEKKHLTLRVVGLEDEEPRTFQLETTSAADREAARRRKANPWDDPVIVQGDGDFEPDDPVHPPLTFSPDGRVLATAGATGAVRLWDVASGTQKAEYLRAAQHAGGPHLGVASLAFAPRAGLAASGGTDGVVKVWDVATWKERRTLGEPGYVSSVAISADGSTVAAVGLTQVRDWEVRVWDAATGRERLQPPLRLAVDPLVQPAVALSADGSRLLVAPGLRPVEVWDVAKRDKLAAWDAPGRVFSPDGKFLLAALSDEVAVYDIANLRVVRKLPTPGCLSRGLAFSPDGRWLVAAVGVKPLGGGRADSDQPWAVGQTLLEFREWPWPLE